MNHVQLKLARQRVSNHAGLPFCHLDTDKDFTVLKRYHVSRTRLPEKLPMQPRHPAIGSEPDENFLQPPQVRPVLAPNFYAKAHRALRKLLKIADVHGHNPLKITHGDFRNCHSERSEESLTFAVG